jgi:hypothetical protein
LGVAQINLVSVYLERRKISLLCTEKEGRYRISVLRKKEDIAAQE